MKSFMKLSLLLLFPVWVNAQQGLPGSVMHELKYATNDSMRYQANHDAYLYFEEMNKDSALVYNDRCLALSEKNGKNLVTARCLASKGYLLTGKGRYGEALNYLFRAFAIAGDPQNADSGWFKDNVWDTNKKMLPEQTRIFDLSLTHHMYAILMRATHNVPQEILHFNEARRLAVSISNTQRVMLADMNLGAAYVLSNKPDSALAFLNEAKELTLRIGPRKYLGYVLMGLGDIALKKGDVTNGKNYYYEGVLSAAEQKNQTSLTWLYLRLTDVYVGEKQKDSSLYFAKKVFHAFTSLGILSGETLNIGTVYQKLYESYQLRGQTDSAYKYARAALAAKDKGYDTSTENLAQFQSISLKEQLRLQNLDKEKVLYQSRARVYALVAGLSILLIIAAILYRNNRQKHRANYLLNEQKEEIATQRDNLGQALHELKNTQTQLIQSEKMASLGELTAGIAHEIQNPLNFINNFSEVNREMLEELKAESEKPKAERDERLENELINDLIENEQKINHHGKRADAIVKGMLEHSRVGRGEKQLTDLNALADEFLKLSYHGLRAKDKNFNADLVTNFDKGLPKPIISQQDIGRVLLNLFNNAFYAVNEKMKTAGDDYKPQVTVSTSSKDNKIQISVRDNGYGIADAIKDKIMQPFFTTKPTGEGTGLGLSLSYDIVVKGHGGAIEVFTKEGEGSEFIILLQINSNV